MARLNTNPLKPVLAGNEGWAATDPSTTDDVGLTPVTITQFAQINMTLATGSTQGPISGFQADKLALLPTETQLDQLLEVAIPLFVSAPATGTQTIYTHVLDPNWQFVTAVGQVSTGTAMTTITINGIPVNGWNNVAVTANPTTFVTPLDASTILASGGKLGLTIGSTFSTPANLAFSMMANQYLA